jgi:hypothetical protein
VSPGADRPVDDRGKRIVDETYPTIGRLPKTGNDF